MTRVACIGEVMIELAPTGAKEALLGVAGDTFNTAVYLKRAAPHLEVDYLTRLGDDPFSDRIRSAIAAEDIGTASIETEPGGTPGLYAITTTDDGERSFTYWRSAAAARGMFGPPDNPDFSALQNYGFVYLSGITLAILPDAMRHALLAALKDADIPLAFDSNYRPALWESPQVAQQHMKAYFDAASISLPSIDDEMALWSETEEEVATRFLATARQGALKRGPGGPLSLGSEVSQDYAQVTSVVDTTAAGDSFNGAYLGAVLSGQDQPQALRAAHDCAARVIQHRGAILPR